VYHSCVLSQIACEWQQPKLMKTEADRVVARDRAGRLIDLRTTNAGTLTSQFFSRCQRRAS
jgi:hypothetical protein